MTHIVVHKSLDNANHIRFLKWMPCLILKAKAWLWFDKDVISRQKSVFSSELGNEILEVYTGNVSSCYKNGHNIFMIKETHAQEKETGHHLKMDSIMVPASAIITLKENKTFNWLILTDIVCSGNRSIGALKTRSLDIRSFVSKLIASQRTAFRSPSLPAFKSDSHGSFTSNICCLISFKFQIRYCLPGW